MKKYLLIKKINNNIFAGIVENKKFVYTFENKLSHKGCLSKGYIENIKKDSNIKSLYFAECLDDKDCIYKVDNTSKRRIKEKDIPNNFYEFIPDDEKDDYEYEYMFLDSKSKGDRRILYCAAVKYEIDRIVEYSNELGVKPAYIVPKNIAIGNVLNNGKSKSNIVVDIGLDKTSVKIFNFNECIANYEIEEGIDNLNLVFEKENISIFDRKNECYKTILKSNEAKSIIGKTIASIVKTIDFYKEKDFCDDGSTLYVSGVGGTIALIIKTLKMATNLNCHSIMELIDGKASINVASVLFGEYGAVLGG